MEPYEKGIITQENSDQLSFTDLFPPIKGAPTLKICDGAWKGGKSLYRGKPQLLTG